MSRPLQLVRMISIFFSISMLLIPVVLFAEEEASAQDPVLEEEVQEEDNSGEVLELRGKIEDRNTKIIELEKEIETYKEELNVVGQEKQSLQGTIQSLNISKKKVQADINITQNKIEARGLEIVELGFDIADKEKSIEKNNKALAETLRRINEIDNNTFVETLLSSENLSEFWDDIESLQQFQTVVREELENLLAFKESLRKTKSATEQKKYELGSFKEDLANQRQILDINKNEKETLLTITKNKESNYKTLIEEKTAEREKFEQELFDFESQLKRVINPDSLPPAEAGILRWPLEEVTVTQYFGNTKFASKNPQVYNGGGHNGVDLRASRGTRVKSALSGIVEGVGNTDSIRGCFSYGKWVLVRHHNGLSTLYAHLSLIRVDPGEELKTGDVVGYSGNTGYSTGPHLHFSVYATDGVEIVRLGDVKTRTNCGDARIPVAPLNAYLNPLSYLPGL